MSSGEKNTNQNFPTFLKKNYLIFILLTTLVFLVYSNSLFNSFVSDDLGQLNIKSWPEKWSVIFTDPLGTIGVTINTFLYTICGTNAGCIRFPNLVFHLGNTFLIFAVVSLLGNKKTATFTSILFSIHPLLSETVNWISAQHYIIYTFFFLTSLLFYIIDNKQPKTSKYYYLSVAFSLVAFFTSRRIFAFPLIILYELVFGDIRKNWKKLIPFAALSLLWLPLQILVIGNQADKNIAANGNITVKVGLLTQIPLALTTYLNLFIFPKDLTFYHSKVFIGTLELVVRWIILILSLGLGVFFFRKRRLLLFSLIFFSFAILLYNNPFGTNWVVAERYVYFASIGLFMIAGFFFAQLSRLKNLYYPTIIAFSTLVLLLSIRTIVRNLDWRNEDSLFVAVAQVVPNDPRALNRQGNIAYSQGDLEKAKEYYLKGVQSNPGFPDSYFNLGNYYKDKNQPDVAQNYYQKALSLDPTHWETLQNLAILTFQKNEVGKAIDYINQAIKSNPRNSSLYNNLGIIYLSLGKKVEAKSAFEKAVAVDPSNTSAQAGLKQLQ